MFTFQRDWSLHISGGVIRNSIFYHLQSLPTSSHQAPRQTLLLQCRLCLKKEKRLPVWKIIVFSVSPDYITFWVMHISTCKDRLSSTLAVLLYFDIYIYSLKCKCKSQLFQGLSVSISIFCKNISINIEFDMTPF